jgi:PII-like signaling protein
LPCLVVIEDIREEIKKFLESNENTTYQNLCNMAKGVLRGKFIAINSYIKISEQF